ncbi:serine endoprotease DegQ ['Osedax' symbiont bacterium Rs2_46_30_T18]|nr:serine endoprotease DegQ ['Osedax' symbiont bacterium Rs2_46_30_T18]
MRAKLYCLFLILFSFTSMHTTAALPATDAQGKVLPSLAPMLQKVNSAVVNIATFSNAQVAQNPLMNDPFFRRFFDSPNSRQRPQQRSSSAGSGVIVDAGRGIVMTNYHVIENADEIRVSLIDGRNFSAKLMGSDPDLDIAVLKIAAKDLTELKLADSSRVQVGDFAVAIGNPFGLGQTVTTGIVSALGRSGLGLKGYENYIQTDASINPGNSGGALVDLAGRLIGINSAIIAPAGGNVGIGFAIPINMAKASLKQILQHGEVRRGQIGVSIQNITDDLRQAFNLKNGQQGVLITGVGDNTPAKRAGLRSGDIITAVDGANTNSVNRLRSQIGIKNIGDKVKLLVLREGRNKTFNMDVGNPQQFSSKNNSNSTQELHNLLVGAGFKNSRSARGVEVTTVTNNSVAAFNGLESGDLITRANKIKVNNLNDFKRALKRSDKALLLEIKRGKQMLLMVIR